MDHTAAKVTASEFLMREQGFQKATDVMVNNPPVTAPGMCWLYQRLYSGMQFSRRGWWSRTAGSSYLDAMFISLHLSKNRTDESAELTSAPTPAWTHAVNNNCFTYFSVHLLCLCLCTFIENKRYECCLLIQASVVY